MSDTQAAEHGQRDRPQEDGRRDRNHVAPQHTQLPQPIAARGQLADPVELGELAADGLVTVRLRSRMVAECWDEAAERRDQQRHVDLQVSEVGGSKKRTRTTDAGATNSA